MSSEHVWAVDPAISHLAFAFAEVPGDHIDVETLITRSIEREGARLGLLDRQVRIYARQAAGRYPPTVVWVEQPSGRFRNLQLVYATGVIQAALYETLGVPVWTIPSSAWKKRTVGAGNATKLQGHAWAEKQRFSFDGQDECDAICIAHAGRQMLTTGTWEAA